MAIAATLALLLGAATAPPLEPPAATWSVVEKLLHPEAGPPLDRPFLFDPLLDLEPAELLRAAAYVAVRSPLPTDPARRPEHERKVRAELGIVLEHYPLIAATGEDFQSLLDTALRGGAPPALRRYLLESCLPVTGLPHPLNRYLSDGLADGAPAAQAALLTLLQSPVEDPTVLEPAIALVEALVEAGFRDALSAPADTKAQDLATMLAAPAAALPEAGRVRLEQQRQTAGAAAMALGIIARDPLRPDALRGKAGEASARLYATYPLPAPEELMPTALPFGPPPIPEP